MIDQHSDKQIAIIECPATDPVRGCVLQALQAFVPAHRLHLVYEGVGARHPHLGEEGAGLSRGEGVAETVGQAKPRDGCHITKGAIAAPCMMSRERPISSPGMKGMARSTA